MAGIALLLDRDLRVVAGGARNWSAFWQANGGIGPAPEMLRQDLTEAFSPGAVRSGFRAALTAVAAGECGPLRLPFRCDAPGVRREMLLTASRCGAGHLLYHALPVHETALPLPLRATSPARHCAVCASEMPGASPPSDAVGLDWVAPAGTVSYPPRFEDVCPRCSLRLMDRSCG